MSTSHLPNATPGNPESPLDTAVKDLLEPSLSPPEECKIMRSEISDPYKVLNQVWKTAADALELLGGSVVANIALSSVRSSCLKVLGSNQTGAKDGLPLPFSRIAVEGAVERAARTLLPKKSDQWLKANLHRAVNYVAEYAIASTFRSVVAEIERDVFQKGTVGTVDFGGHKFIKGRVLSLLQLWSSVESDHIAANFIVGELNRIAALEIKRKQRDLEESEAAFSRARATVPEVVDDLYERRDELAAPGLVPTPEVKLHALNMTPSFEPANTSLRMIGIANVSGREAKKYEELTPQLPKSKGKEKAPARYFWSITDYGNSGSGNYFEDDVINRDVSISIAFSESGELITVDYFTYDNYILGESGPGVKVKLDAPTCALMTQKPEWFTVVDDDTFFSSGEVAHEAMRASSAELNRPAPLHLTAEQCLANPDGRINAPLVETSSGTTLDMHIRTYADALRLMRYWRMKEIKLEAFWINEQWMYMFTPRRGGAEPDATARAEKMLAELAAERAERGKAPTSSASSSSSTATLLSNTPASRADPPVPPIGSATATVNQPATVSPPTAPSAPATIDPDAQKAKPVADSGPPNAMSVVPELVKKLSVGDAEKSKLIENARYALTNASGSGRRGVVESIVAGIVTGITGTTTANLFGNDGKLKWDAVAHAAGAFLGRSLPTLIALAGSACEHGLKSEPLAAALLPIIDSLIEGGKSLRSGIPLGRTWQDRVASISYPGLSYLSVGSDGRARSIPQSMWENTVSYIPQFELDRAGLISANTSYPTFALNAAPAGFLPDDTVAIDSAYSAMMTAVLANDTAYLSNTFKSFNAAVSSSSPANVLAIVSNWMNQIPEMGTAIYPWLMYLKVMAQLTPFPGNNAGYLRNTAIRFKDVPLVRSSVRLPGNANWPVGGAQPIGCGYTSAGRAFRRYRGFIPTYNANITPDRYDRGDLLGVIMVPVSASVSTNNPAFVLFTMLHLGYWADFDAVGRFSAPDGSDLNAGDIPLRHVTSGMIVRRPQTTIEFVNVDSVEDTVFPALTFGGIAIPQEGAALTDIRVAFEQAWTHDNWVSYSTQVAALIYQFYGAGELGVAMSTISAYVRLNSGWRDFIMGGAGIISRTLHSRTADTSTPFNVAVPTDGNVTFGNSLSAWYRMCTADGELYSTLDDPRVDIPIWGTTFNIGYSLTLMYRAVAILKLAKTSVPAHYCSPGALALTMNCISLAQKGFFFLQAGAHGIPLRTFLPNLGEVNSIAKRIELENSHFRHWRNVVRSNPTFIYDFDPRTNYSPIALGAHRTATMGNYVTMPELAPMLGSDIWCPSVQEYTPSSLIRVPVYFNVDLNGNDLAGFRYGFDFAKLYAFTKNVLPNSIIGILSDTMNQEGTVLTQTTVCAYEQNVSTYISIPLCSELHALWFTTYFGLNAVTPFDTYGGGPQAIRPSWAFSTSRTEFINNPTVVTEPRYLDIFVRATAPSFYASVRIGTLGLVVKNGDV